MATKERKRFSLDPIREELRWQKCSRCSLALGAFKRCWGDGVLPCKLLIVGEAPGMSEDVMGKPFVGPSGAVLREALPAQKDVPWFITNMVACVPWKDDRRGVREPSSEEIRACAMRLQWICRQSRPQKIVLVGQVAGRYASSFMVWTPGCLVVKVEHPASALRRGKAATERWVELARRILTV